MSRHPFGVPGVPDPGSEDVTAFARGVPLTGSGDDGNAGDWHMPSAALPASIEGDRPGHRRAEGVDRQTGPGQPKSGAERACIQSHWHDATGQGLTEVRRARR